ncbi:MAG: hypothetical protein PVG83_05990 [Acidimicrobiia bacterium]|jgi:hypothetical protein
MSTNGGIVPETVSLGPFDVISERPFTAVEMTARDKDVLHDILADLRGVAAEVEEGVRKLDPYQKLAWRVGGLTHRLLVCNFERLRFHPGLCVVGFFAERRTDVDMWPLEEANSEIVSEFVKYPGILSYSSVELPDGHWANMVLHDDPVDTSFWRESKLHAQAVESLSPQHYFNVRIHNGNLTAGVFNRPSIDIHKTKYFDYTGPVEWRAERVMATVGEGG